MTEVDEYALFTKDFSADDVADDGTSGLSSRVLSVLRTALDRCEMEKQLKALKIPLENYVGRVAHYTGYLPEVVLQIRDNFEKADQSTTKSYDVAERIILIRNCHNMYLQGKAATYLELYKMSEELIEIPSFYQFRMDLFKLGFYYMPISTGYNLSEDPKIRYERIQFLRKIKKFRSEGVPITYLDERIINQEQTYLKPNIGSKQELVLYHDNYAFFHAISDKKIQKYFFCNVVTKQLFEKWIVDVLLKHLPPKSVIIIDNNKLHGDLINNNITKYHSKKDILKWLRHNNVPCSSSMQKADLFDLAKKCKRNEHYFYFDRLLKGFGFEVLRLPFGCNKLSISELLWQHLSSLKVLGSSDLDHPVLTKENIITKIDATLSQKWNVFEKLIIGWEYELLSLDMMTDDILEDKFEIDVNKIVHNDK